MRCNQPNAVFGMDSTGHYFVSVPLSSCCTNSCRKENECPGEAWSSRLRLMHDSHLRHSPLSTSHLPASTTAGEAALSLAFACFTSCAGSFNRRPVELLITAEYANRLIGCDSLDTRVSASPRRDIKAVTEKGEAGVQAAVTVTPAAPKSAKRGKNDAVGGPASKKAKGRGRGEGAASNGATADADDAPSEGATKELHTLQVAPRSL